MPSLRRTKQRLRELLTIVEWLLRLDGGNGLDAWKHSLRVSIHLLRAALATACALASSVSFVDF